MCFYVIVYRLRVDVRKSGTTQIQNVLDKGYDLFLVSCMIKKMLYEHVNRKEL